MNVATYNPCLIFKLLNRAGHVSTTDNEALTAVRMAGAHCLKSGKMLGEIAMDVEADMYLSIRSTPEKQFLSEIADLQIARTEAQNHCESLTKLADTLQAEIASLKSANGDLSQRLKDVETTRVVEEKAREAAPVQAETNTPDETVVRSARARSKTRYAQLREAVLDHSPVGPHWRELFKEGTGTSDETMQEWKRTDNIPDSAFDAVFELSLDVKRPPHRCWSQAETTRCAELTKAGLPLAKIAATLSSEFGRPFSTGAVQQRRFRGL